MGVVPTYWYAITLYYWTQTALKTANWCSGTGRDQTLLQNLLLPLFVAPTLLPTPLLEPRYFLVPYVLLRAQVSDVPNWGVALEGLWYAAINAATMWVFLYNERAGVGRFMW
jgi:alpha-1,2-glucosyltransferase